MANDRMGTPPETIAGWSCQVKFDWSPTIESRLVRLNSTCAFSVHSVAASYASAGQARR